MAIYNFMVVQQKDGYGEFSFTYETANWIKNPVIEAEHKFSKIFCGIEFKLELEETGERIGLAHEIVMNARRDFEVKLTVPTGGPYVLYSRMTFCDDGRMTYFPWTVYRAHIGVGDVFLIAGQSNAAGTGRGTLRESPEFGISAFRKDGTWDIATHPLSGTTDKHAPFLTFAKKLFHELGYPIGLIPRAVGGTYITQWMQGGNLMEPLKEELAREGVKAKAILWYQGENEADANDTASYFENLENAFGEMRAALGEPKLPIFLFQLNRTTFDWKDEGYSKIREIQRTVPKKIENTYLIPTIDMASLSDWIHNNRAGNMALGERLASYALDYLYDKRVTAKALDLAHAYKSAPDTLVLELDNLEGEIYAFGASAADLPIDVIDGGGEVPKASYTISENTISVKFAREICTGATVRAMYGSNPRRIIIDLETQMPLLPFHNIKIE